MAKLKVVKIVRSGKFQSRVETSDGHQLVLDHMGSKPFIGMELDIEEVKASPSELRPLEPWDNWPSLLKGDLQI